MVGKRADLQASIVALFICMLLDQLSVSSLTVQDFYPFGPESNDSQLRRGDDVAESVRLDFSFFGELYTSIGVSISINC